MMLTPLIVYPDADYHTFEDATHARVDVPLQGDLLIRIDREGRVEDHFRVVFRGNEGLRAEFAASQILPQPRFAGFRIRCDKPAHGVKLRNNSFASRWEDLEALVAGGGLQVVDQEGQDAAPAFRAAWEEGKSSESRPAAAVRWATQAHPSYGFRLTLQGLPRGANGLRKDARLCADNTAAVELAGWIAPAVMAKGGPCHGPAPILFAVDVEETKRRVAAHPDRLHQGKGKMSG